MTVAMTASLTPLLAIQETLASACGWSALRALGVAVLVGVLAAPVPGLLTHRVRPCRRLAWLLLLVPLFTPTLIAGYAYAGCAVAWLHDPLGRELLYVALLTGKLLPIGAAVLWLAPSPVTREAVHAHRLLRAGRKPFPGPKTTPRPAVPCPAVRNLGRSLAPLFLGRAAPHVLAGGLVFLLAFGDFETAALLDVTTWTVPLFDAQVGGLALGESLRLIRIPLVVNAAIVGLTLVILLGRIRRAGDPGPAENATGNTVPGWSGRLRSLAGWGALAGSALVVTGVPVLRMTSGMIQGLPSLLDHPSLFQDIATSLAFALAAALLAQLAAGSLMPGRTAPSAPAARFRLALLAALALPGLLGSLVLGLGVVALFQMPVLRPFYDTPIPLLLALVALLLPVALVLGLARKTTRPGPGLHLAALLGAAPSPLVRQNAARLRWRLHLQPAALGFCLLATWGYFELTASALLAPSRMTPVLVRLHNLMHYGESAVLSAMAAMAMAAPLTLFLVVWLAAGAGRGLGLGSVLGLTSGRRHG